MPATTFDAVDRDGEVLGSFTIGDDAAARSTVVLAQEALPAWSDGSVGARCRVLRAWRGELWRTSGRLAETLHRESGLGFDEAMLEVLRTVEHLRWVEKHAADVLGPSNVARGVLSPEVGSTTTWVAEGVVAVVAHGRPSLYAAASAVACALVAGNTVVLQPGQRVTATLAAYVEAFARADRAAPAGIVQVLTGDESTAVALAGSPVDRVCFLGTPVAGVRVSTAAARALVPVTVVPVVAPVTLVAPDADLELAARAVADLARAGAGGPAPEVFVAPSVLDEFAAALDRAEAPEPRRRGPIGALRGRRTAPAELPGPRADLRVETAPAFEVLVDRLRAHPSAQVAIHSVRHGARLADLLSAAEVTVNLPAGSASAGEGGLPRAALGSRGYGPLAGEAGLHAFARIRTTTSRRRLPIPVAPVEALLATPPARIATRLALHLRHSLD